MPSGPDKALVPSAVPPLDSDPRNSPPPVPLEKVLVPSRDGGSGSDVRERPWPGSGGEGALGASSASGLSDESSSPDVLPPGFERNQLNQPNPEFFLRPFTSPGFSLCAAFWEDVLSASSEASPSSSLTETLELSDLLRALGISGACGLETAF